MGHRDMVYVYVLRSKSHPTQTYVGFTRDLKARIAVHNHGASPHTRQFIPWSLEFYCAFPDEAKARAFERYLKSHSGKAFAKKRLL